VATAGLLQTSKIKTLVQNKTNHVRTPTVQSTQAQNMPRLLHKGEIGGGQSQHLVL